MGSVRPFVDHRNNENKNEHYLQYEKHYNRHSECDHLHFGRFAPDIQQGVLKKLLSRFPPEYENISFKSV